MVTLLDELLGTRTLTLFAHHESGRWSTIVIGLDDSVYKIKIVWDWGFASKNPPYRPNRINTKIHSVEIATTDDYQTILMVIEVRLINPPRVIELRARPGVDGAYYAIDEATNLVIFEIDVNEQWCYALDLEGIYRDRPWLVAIEQEPQSLVGSSDE